MCGGEHWLISSSFPHLILNLHLLFLQQPPHPQSIILHHKLVAVADTDLYMIFSHNNYCLCLERCVHVLWYTGDAIKCCPEYLLLDWWCLVSLIFCSHNILNQALINSLESGNNCYNLKKRKLKMLYIFLNWSLNTLVSEWTCESFTEMLHSS